MEISRSCVDGSDVTDLSDVSHEDFKPLNLQEAKVCNQVVYIRGFLTLSSAATVPGRETVFRRRPGLCSRSVYGGFTGLGLDELFLQLLDPRFQ